MSEPVKSVAMEDVLSSIRRLVTEDHRGESRDGARPDTAPVGRLVLTPALRVAQDDGAEQGDPQDGDTRLDDAQDAAPWSDPGATLYHAMQDAASEPHREQSDDDAGDAMKDDSELPGESAPRPGTRADTLSAKIAALESAIAQTQDQWEPDGAVGDDYAGTHVETLEWQDHEDGPDDAAPDAPAPEDIYEDEDEALDFLVADDTVMDEETLRELVAEIVREELQGALGERITRNVRKLVRREIHRALTAQEFE